MLVRQALPNREDLLSPGDLTRDEDEYHSGDNCDIDVNNLEDIEDDYLNNELD